MSVAEAVLQQQVEEAERAGRMVERQLRKYLAGALCAGCGEPLGEEREIVMDDDERTVHAECETKESGEISPMPITLEDMDAQDRIAHAINDAINDAQDAGCATGSTQLAARIMVHPKVRALIPALAQYDLHKQES